MNRAERAKLAAETLQILERGAYTNDGGSTVSLGESIARAAAGTQIVAPSDWESVARRARSAATSASAPRIEVTGETTLAAARRLIGGGRRDVVALNFASAKNPGGGFLSGSLAQEESLAVASGLYQSLLVGEGSYYAANRKSGSALYTDHAIYSPGVPVFRDDDGRLLALPYELSFITMPAPNRGAIPSGSPDRGRVGSTLRRRIRCVLSLAAAHVHRAIVLGAWGCGVFRNEPTEVATLFREALEGAEGWGRCFEHVVFAVFDRTENAGVRRAFENALGSPARQSAGA